MNRLMWSLGILAAAGFGCGSSNRLEPATAQINARDHLVQLDEDTVVDRSTSVSVKAELDAWPGNQGIHQHVTPIRVTLRNSGDRAVRVQYRNFALQTPSGQRARALPPFQIEGSVRQPTLPTRYGVIDPALHHPGFRVDPMYATLWPGMPPYSRSIGYDHAYWGATYAYWRQPLPTPEMRQRVLPEGVLEPGGRVSGFLYFEKLGDRATRARLVTTLVDAESGQQIATSQIPFVVEEG